MAALSASRKTKFTYGGIESQFAVSKKYPLAASVTCYESALIGLNTAGYAGPLSSTYAYGFVGFCQKEVTESTGVAGGAYVEVVSPPFVSQEALEDVTFTIADLGKIVWASTDNTADLALTGTSTHTPIGIVGEMTDGNTSYPVLVSDESFRFATSGINIPGEVSADTTIILSGAPTTGQIRVKYWRGKAILNIDADQARTLTLPAANIASGVCPEIIIAGTQGNFDITISDPTGPTTVGLLAQNERGMAFTDGASWYFGYWAKNN